MSAQPSNLPREQLLGGLPHVLDTFDQAGALYAWRVISKGLPAAAKDGHLGHVVGQASLESSLVNLRALNEFFRARQSIQDDMRATQWPGYTTPGPFMSEDDEKEINKRLAHLTWHRETPHEGHFVRKNLGLAVERIVHFLRFLRADFLTLQDPLLARVNDLEKSLQQVLPEW